MTNLSSAPRASWIVRFVWLLLAALLLWWLWGWQPLPEDLPEDLTIIRTAAQLSALLPGRTFALEGEIHPAQPVERTWQGRFVWMRTAQSKRRGQEPATVVTEDVRPRVAIVWTGGELILPEDSYDLRYAPRVPDDPWYDWSQTNRGFKRGDLVVARGEIGPSGLPIVESLVAGPLAHPHRLLGQSGTTRFWLFNLLRVFLTLVVIFAAWTALQRGRP